MIIIFKDGFQPPPRGGEGTDLLIGLNQYTMELLIKVGCIGSRAVGVELDECLIVGNEEVWRVVYTMKHTTATLLE